MERYNKGLEMKDLFLKILNADCPHIYVENPTPMRVYNLPKESQVIQPWMFGDNYLKRTCLWLRGLPPLTLDVKIKPDGVVCWVNAGTKKKDGSKQRNIGIKSSASDRSKTFPGIARAWAEQWTKYLHGLTNNTTTTVKDI